MHIPAFVAPSILVPYFVLSDVFVKIYRYIYAEFPKGNTIVRKCRFQDFKAQFNFN